MLQSEFVLEADPDDTEYASGLRTCKMDDNFSPKAWNVSPSAGARKKTP